MPSNSTSREVNVPAFAKLNLSLLVLGRRGDGFHELRTIFQTISLADSLRLRYSPRGPFRVSLDDPLAIPDNLILRAAHAVAEATNLKGTIEITLNKRIPMGGGLGGGSTDAAAVLLALPALSGRGLAAAQLHAIATVLGSDVPFFLSGGTALGLSRGEELYPIPTPVAAHVLLLTPGVHVSTPDAYRELARLLLSELTFTELIPKLETFRACVEAVSGPRSSSDWNGFCQNDFEAVVFGRHPQLAVLRRKLEMAGACPARMSGSGSTLFGVFPSRAVLREARDGLGAVPSVMTSFVSRARYRSAWIRALGSIVHTTQWPPQSLSASNASSTRRSTSQHKKSHSTSL
ncbi:MAG TPA: 4-(cytidine 5'-diphospho)-2-C-methyl-D-erythritol kinase [Bryobacteraceae bacterium]|nr:4-(cytidine 5'-diphospho)-2-C-methyl-D-erythritol kinase [Bryobacteraceae bacterium]